METWPNWILAIVAVITTVSALLSWANRIQARADKSEMIAKILESERRLALEIGAGFVTQQAHNDLAKRVDRIEEAVDNYRRWQG
jgi:hypothetical protein